MAAHFFPLSDVCLVVGVCQPRYFRLTEVGATVFLKENWEVYSIPRCRFVVNIRCLVSCVSLGAL